MALQNPRDIRVAVIGLAAFVITTLTVIFEVWSNPNQLLVWALVAGSMLTSVVGLGLLIAGRWDGVLIDFRNKVSLARLQILLWTLVILSAWFTVMIVRMAADAVAEVSPDSESFMNCQAQIIADKAKELDVSNLATPENQTALAAATAQARENCVRDRLNINFPTGLWVALGISAASLGGSSLVKKIKDDNDTLDIKTSSPVTPQDADNIRPGGPELADLFRGDSAKNRDQIDLSKVLMFFFTLIIVIGYAAAVGALLNDQAETLRPLGVDMPALTGSINIILGLSHASYLGIKAAE